MSFEKCFYQIWLTKIDSVFLIRIVRHLKMRVFENTITQHSPAWSTPTQNYFNRQSPHTCIYCIDRLVTMFIHAQMYYTMMGSLNCQSRTGTNFNRKWIVNLKLLQSFPHLAPCFLCRHLVRGANINSATVTSPLCTIFMFAIWIYFMFFFVFFFGCVYCLFDRLVAVSLKWLEM